MNIKDINIEKHEALSEEENKQWFEELFRICAEAEERYKNGELLPALSSLAAIPPLQQTLVKNCVAASKEKPTQSSKDQTPGLYI